MTLDIICAILLVMAIFKGYQRGFIIAVFSYLGVIIGLIASLKLAVVVAQWLKEHASIGTKWLPFLSFLIVMIGVVLLIRIVAIFLQKSIELLFMGWANRLGGILLYCFIYFTVLSIVLFFIEKMGLLKKQSGEISSGYFYIYIKPLGPAVINWITSFVPTLQHLFGQLESFFG